jgi:hypothetical protein
MVAWLRCERVDCKKGGAVRRFFARSGGFAQHILLHLAAIKVEKRHRGVVAERAGGQPRFEFAQHLLGHRIQIASGFDPSSTQTRSVSGWITPGTTWAVAFRFNCHTARGYASAFSRRDAPELCVVCRPR